MPSPSASSSSSSKEITTLISIGCLVVYSSSKLTWTWQPVILGVGLFLVGLLVWKILEKIGFELPDPLGDSKNTRHRVDKKTRQVLQPWNPPSVMLSNLLGQWAGRLLFAVYIGTILWMALNWPSKDDSEKKLKFSMIALVVGTLLGAEFGGAVRNHVLT